MATQSTTIQLTLLSAEGLHVRGKPANTNVFAVVRADSIASHTTATATESNGSLSWEETFSLEVGPYARCLTIEVKCRTGAGERDVGVARIALSDFLGRSLPGNRLQLCYRLRDWDGRENGTVNFSVRVVAQPQPHAAADENGCESSLGGVVTGIPVWLEKS
ncbi:BON1-associated protein 1-like [Vigna umbellata]|uniref:BON1-associated protein 1-like n=1 Tax=Vigna umbellata TaxID=87088 RepID=UPI001F5ED2E9|nr:BON1-associated protein 1-like [Vigna umbellata]